MEKIIEQLKTLQNVKPRQEWVELQRGLLLSQIKSQTTARKQSRILNTWFLAKSVMPTGLLRFAGKPLGAFTVLLVFVFSTGMLGVSASRGSMPGDLLYSVKRTSEKMQAGMALTKEKKGALYVRFAEERVKEIENVTQNQDAPEQKVKNVAVAVEGLKDEMKKAQANLDEVKQTPRRVRETVDMAHALDVKSEEIGKRIEQKKSETADKAIVEKLEEAQAATAAAGVKALEVIVEKRAQGEVTLPESELVKTIDNKIEKAKEALKQVEVKVEQAKISAENAKPVLEIESIDSGSAVNSATPVKETAAGGVSAIENKPAEAKQILTEAKDMLNHGDLSSAMEKVIQSAEIATEMTAEAKLIAE